jgi:hypothetical protein
VPCRVYARLIEKIRSDHSYFLFSKNNMARIEDKIAEIRNAELRQTIAAEVCELKDLLKKGRRFGLVFEEHLPELLPI